MVIRWVRYSLRTLLLAVATVRLPPGVVAAGAVPVLLLVPALLAGFVAPAGTAALLGWGLGFALDLFSLEPLGFHAFLFAAAAWAVARVKDAVFADHPATRAVIGAIAAFLVLLVMLLRVAAAESPFAWPARLPPAFLSALLTGAAVPLLGLVDRRLNLFGGFRERRRRV